MTESAFRAPVHNALSWRVLALLAMLVLGATGCGADPACASGATDCAVCVAPLADCNRDAKDGCEVSTENSPLHCGECGRQCPGATQKTALCRKGNCETCPGGFLDCDSKGENGCEQDINFDPNHCGGCNKKCSDPAHGIAVCFRGVCGLRTCVDGFDDCDGSLANGCELNVLTDLNNCGACGRKCPAVSNAMVTCQMGACNVVCATGFASCGIVAACETDIRISTSHCGGCNKPCAAGRPCTNGVCT